MKSELMESKTKKHAMKLLPLIVLSVSAGCGPKTAVSAAALQLPGARSVALPSAENQRGMRIVGGDVLRAIWVEDEGEDAVIRTAFLDGSSWSQPSRVSTARGVRTGAGREPMLATRDDGTLVAYWFEEDGARRATSSDAGATWSDAARLADGLGAGEGAFRWVDPKSETPSAVWLGSRKSLPWAPLKESVLFMGLDANGAAESKWILMERAFPPGGVATAMTPLGRLVACRAEAPPTSIDAGENAVAILGLKSNGRGDGRAFFETDGWRPGDGAGSVGPVIAARGSQVAAAWYTEAGGPTLKLTVSRNSARNFLGGVKFGVPQGMHGLAITFEAPDRVLVVWLSKQGAGSVLLGRRIDTRRGRTGTVALLQPEVQIDAEDLWIDTAGGKTYAAWRAGRDNAIRLVEIAPGAP